jgi:hypothetical protein
MKVAMRSPVWQSLFRPDGLEKEPPLLHLPIIADELRRQADAFIDLIELNTVIGRDTLKRPQDSRPAPRGVRCARD